MNTNPTRRAHDFNLEHFRIRLTARLYTITVCIVQYIPRIPIMFADPSIQPQAWLFLLISLPFPILMILTILFEYFLYKKVGPEIVKYSGMVDIVLLLTLSHVEIAFLKRVQQTHPISFSLGALYGITSFAWRGLFVTLIVQKWHLKIIPPVASIVVATIYAIHYTTGTLVFTFLSCCVQIFNIIIIVYGDDKVKWRMVWANIQQEKWMQVNNFILNSIPENIMILDLSGEIKFISEYCKAFMNKCRLNPTDTKGFFKKVQDLQQQQQYEPAPQSPSTSIIHMERLTTINPLLTENEDRANTLRYQVLEDLINNFKDIIINNEIQEQQFLIYNGKLKLDNRPDKSLEVKISFVQHFEHYYIIVIIRDTTNRDKLITLQETNKYKDQLLASVSHELRAPLNGNINLIESAVNSPKIPESVKESCLIPALRSSKFLLHIINDILDMSQIKEKKLRLIFNFDKLKETLKSTTQLVELQAKKKGIKLLIEIDPTLPKTFCTDHIRLSQIVLNLLNNAIKFTHEGTIKLLAKPTREDPNLIQISVEDSGIGMTQESLRKLFFSYTHIEFEGRQEVNPTGVGLGLNIAYNLALLLGPENQQGISVSSVVGQGSNFTFTLENKQKVPLEEDSCEVAEESSKIIQSTLFPTLHTNSSLQLLPTKASFDDFCSCPKILIVDDNPFNTMAFETILSSLDIKCEAAFSGSAAIKNLMERENKKCCKNCRQYSVVFMDQEMPEMNGVETACTIKRLEKQYMLSPGIKIIGCTAHKSQEEVNKFLNAGIEQCIHKPISPNLIKDILKDIVL